MEELLKYYIQESDKRFDKIDSSLADLHSFKASMVSSARLTSLIVSGICGFLTLLASWALVYYSMPKAPL